MNSSACQLTKTLSFIALPPPNNQLAADTKQPRPIDFWYPLASVSGGKALVVSAVWRSWRLGVRRTTRQSMTVEDAEQVDLVAQRETEVRLVVSDHLDWSDELEHFRLLQNKLNAYLAFYESGRLFDTYPESRGKTPSIHISFLHAPTPHAESHLLQPATEVVATAGLTLSWSVGSAARRPSGCTTAGP